MAVVSIAQGQGFSSIGEGRGAPLQERTLQAEGGRTLPEGGPRCLLLSGCVLAMLSITF